jgi:hypothetical protein
MLKKKEINDLAENQAINLAQTLKNFSAERKRLEEH